MRAVVQRVKNASVTVDGETVGEIGSGLLVYLGVTRDDGPADTEYVVSKILNLRIFDDENGVPNLSVQDVNGSVLLVSQFTLYGDARKGRRPSYFDAAPPELANALYEEAAEMLKKSVPVETGRFRTEMMVFSVNHGPFTILLDSRRNF